MTNAVTNQYVPDYVSPPGVTLLEILEERGMTQADLANRTGRPRKTINEIIHGKETITPQTALQFERVLGTPASFWNNRERIYRQHLAQIEDIQQLQNQVDWVEQFSIKAMNSLGWIRLYDDAVQQLQELLRFFGVVSPAQWDTLWGQSQAAFRKTPVFASAREDTSAWLRQGEIQAQDIECVPYNKRTFQEVLYDIRQQTSEQPDVFMRNIVELCSYAGVAVVLVPQLPNAKVSGATRWLSKDKALIQLSLRYKKDDHFWFTFFHEAGHILLHGKRDVFLENDDETSTSETEADKFASSFLIPPYEMKRFLRSVKPGCISTKNIQDFSDRLGIAPGITVGRLQHDKHIPYKNGNGLKRTFTWK